MAAQSCLTSRLDSSFTRHSQVLKSIGQSICADVPTSHSHLSSQTHRVLPVRREILLGILNCDLIGFHTYDYARHFLSSVSRLLGLKCFPNRQSSSSTIQFFC